MANEYKRWRGAVEPAETAPSGNQFKRWRGAVEPAAPEPEEKQTHQMML